jgi:hypothetical protein
MEPKFQDHVDKSLPPDHILSKLNLIHYITLHRIPSSHAGHPKCLFLSDLQLTFGLHIVHFRAACPLYVTSTVTSGDKHKSWSSSARSTC